MAAKDKAGERRRRFPSEAGIDNDSFKEGGPSYAAMARELAAAQKAADGKPRRGIEVAERDRLAALGTEAGWSYNDMSDALGRSDNGTFPFRRGGAWRKRVEALGLETSVEASAVVEAEEAQRDALKPPKRTAVERDLSAPADPKAPVERDLAAGDVSVKDEGDFVSLFPKSDKGREAIGADRVDVPRTKLGARLSGLDVRDDLGQPLKLRGWKKDAPAGGYDFPLSAITTASVRVLLASDEASALDGKRTGKGSDFHHALNGELLSIPALICEGDAANRANCGCDRSFVGLASGQSTTLGVVADVTTQTVKEALAFHRAAMIEAWQDETLADSRISDARQLWSGVKDVEPGTLVRIKSTPNQYRIASAVKGGQVSPPAVIVTETSSDDADEQEGSPATIEVDGVTIPGDDSDLLAGERLRAGAEELSDERRGAGLETLDEMTDLKGRDRDAVRAFAKRLIKKDDEALLATELAHTNEDSMRAAAMAVVLGAETAGRGLRSSRDDD